MDVCSRLFSSVLVLLQLLCIAYYFVYLLHMLYFLVVMLFESRSQLVLLAEEIENEMENICLNVVVTMTTSTDASAGPDMAESTSVETTMISGIARIPLYTMIENSCHIIRHEVDIIKSSSDSDVGNKKQSVIGSIVIDVRGYQLLEQCS